MTDLAAVSKKLDTVLEKLAGAGNIASRKDRLDKFQLLATVFIAFFAMFFSFLGSYRDSSQREAFHRRESEQRDRVQAENIKVQEMQLINSFLPYLTGTDEKKKELAVRAVSHLSNPELAAIFAGIAPSPGTAAGLNTIKRTPGLPSQDRARIDTALNRFPSTSRGVLEILDVPGGGLRPDSVYVTDTVPTAPPSPGTRPGTKVCGIWRDPTGAVYCAGPCSVGQTCGVVAIDEM